MIRVRIERFAHPNSRPLLSGVELELRKGEVVSLMGRSGVGKSTLARIVAGIETGSGFVVERMGLQNLHDVVYVDQDPMQTVFPWQTAHTNLCWPLLQLGWSRVEADRRANQLLEEFRLSHRARAFPLHLSGGEVGRLALARCLSWRPRVAVLDESFASLDAQTREELIRLLGQIVHVEGLSVLLVTHSLSDALSLANRCVVLAGLPATIAGEVPVTPASSRTPRDPGIVSAREALLDHVRGGTLD